MTDAASPFYTDELAPECLAGECRCEGMHWFFRGGSGTRKSCHCLAELRWRQKHGLGLDDDWQEGLL